jgi:ribosomal protein S18 acetylase RimI-like enzyme
LALHNVEETARLYLRLDKSMDHKRLAMFEQADARDDTPLKAYEKDIEIAHVAVEPAFQRRGIGQKLVKVAQDIAVERKRPLFLVASKNGKGMYTKCGFREIGQLSVVGIVGPCMVWEP